MEPLILKKNFYKINLSDNDIKQQLVINKSLFLDTKANNKKDLFLEIEHICKSSFSCNECNLKLINSSNSIVLDNGILLINKMLGQIKDNYLIFLRSKYPIIFNKKLGNYADMIFTLFTPRGLHTSSKLQLLSKVSILLKRSNIRKKIMGANKAEDIITLFIKT